MTIRVDVEPDLLLWAVDRAGWDRETIERRAPKFDAWVHGIQKPTLKQLEQFAKNTHTPFGMLFLPQRPVETIPIPDMRTLGNVGVQQPSADLLDTIYLCQSRQEWYRSYAQENDAPKLPFVGSATTNTPPETIASQMSAMLNFGLVERNGFSNWQDALRTLIDNIEALGVLVMVSGIVGSNTHRILNPEEFRGFALSDPIAPLIFVNGADTKAAQLFTLIHELAHIWLGQSALTDATLNSRETHKQELWCNKVAAEVLVPLHSLKVEYAGPTSTRELERLARKYKVSTLVILKRLFDADFLEWADYQRHYADELDRLLDILEARKQQSGGGNYYNTQPLRLSRLFARAVIASTYEGTTTFREAYQLLGTTRHATFQKLATSLGIA